MTPRERLATSSAVIQTTFVVPTKRLFSVCTRLDGFKPWKVTQSIFVGGSLTFLQTRPVHDDSIGPQMLRDVPKKRRTARPGAPQDALSPSRWK